MKACIVLSGFLFGSTLLAGTTRWTPAPLTTWQIQFSGAINLAVNAQVFELDLFDTSPQTIAQLHQKGRRVVCYFSTQYENYRPDAAAFPAAVLGQPIGDWEGERWVDIRRLDVLQPIMTGRMDLARSKGCDGVKPDNVDGWTNQTGFPLTANDQFAWNVMLANDAHARGLAVGLMNDLEQVEQLVPYFDFAENESCNVYNECGLVFPFVRAGKAVFHIEYSGNPTRLCPKFNQWRFSSIFKRTSLNAYRVSCR